MFAAPAGLVLPQSYQLKTLSGSETCLALGRTGTLTRVQGLLTALLIAAVAGIGLQAATVAQAETSAAKSKSAAKDKDKPQGQSTDEPKSPAQPQPN